MKTVLASVLLLGSFSVFAQSFQGVDNLGNDCSVEMKPLNLKKKISEITIKTSELEFTGEVKHSTRLLKIKTSKLLSAYGPTATYLDHYARVNLEDGMPYSFSIQSDVVKTTEVREFDYDRYNRGRDRYDSYRTRIDVRSVSTKTVVCELQ